MKRILVIGAAVVALVVVGVVYLYSSLGSIIQAAVERYGSEIVGAEVTLDSADISATEGTGTLSGLTVGNPEPFATDAALRLGEVKVTLDPASIGSDVIRIKEVLIAAPQVTYELSGSGSNLAAIQKNVDAYVKKMGSGTQEKAASGDDAAGPKLVIDRLLVRDGQIRVSAAPLGGKTLDAALPAIEIKDIGKDSGGASPGEVAEKVIAQLNAAVGKGTAALNLDSIMQGAAGIAKGATDAIRQGAGDVGAKVQDGVKGAAESLGQGATDAIGKGMKDTQDALKGLLGGGK